MPRRVAIVALAGALGAASCRTVAVPIGTPEAPSNEVELELYERLCSDSVGVGQEIVTRVPSSKVNGGLFAHVLLRDVNVASGVFRFDVVELVSLTHSLAVRAPAVSVDAAELQPGRACLRARSRLRSSVAGDVARFEGAASMTSRR